MGQKVRTIPLPHADPDFFWGGRGPRDNFVFRGGEAGAYFREFYYAKFNKFECSRGRSENPHHPSRSAHAPPPGSEILKLLTKNSHTHPSSEQNYLEFINHTHFPHGITLIVNVLCLKIYFSILLIRHKTIKIIFQR